MSLFEEQHTPKQLLRTLQQHHVNSNLKQLNLNRVTAVTGVSSLTFYDAARV